MRRILVGLGALAGLVAFAAGSTTAYAERQPGSHHGGRPLVAQLDAAHETPPNGSPGTGTALITVNHGHGEICWTINVQNLTAPATAAHIHVAPPGVPGPIVVPLSPPVNGSSRGCTTADRDLAKAILKHPENYYVNVHTSTFPGGEIRGQLDRG